MTPNFTDQVQNTFQKAIQLAVTKKNSEIHENHLLLAFFEEPQGYFQTFFNSFNVDTSDLIENLKKDIDKLPTLSAPSGSPPALL